jgi:hypothetical protein
MPRVLNVLRCEEMQGKGGITKHTLRESLTSPLMAFGKVRLIHYKASTVASNLYIAHRHLRSRWRSCRSVCRTQRKRHDRRAKGKVLYLNAVKFCYVRESVVQKLSTALLSHSTIVIN